MNELARNHLVPPVDVAREDCYDTSHTASGSIR